MFTFSQYGIIVTYGGLHESVIFTVRIRVFILLHFHVIVNSRKGVKIIITNATEYGQQVQMKLIEMRKSQSWLIDEIKSRTDMYIDGSILFKVLTGRVKSQRITDAIRDAIGVEFVE